MGKAILSLGTEKLKCLLLYMQTCSPLSVLPSQQTCGDQSFAVAVAVVACSEICHGGEKWLALEIVDHDRARQMCAESAAELWPRQGSSAY